MQETDPENTASKRPDGSGAEAISRSIDTLRRHMVQVEELKNDWLQFRDALKARTEMQIKTSIGDIFGKQSAEFQQHQDLQIDLASKAAIDETVTILEDLIRGLEMKRLALLGVGAHVSPPVTGIDPVTGLNGRLFFDEYLTKELNRSERHSFSATIVRFALSNLYETGTPREAESVLLNFARICKSSLRGYDVACRIADEEFALLLPQSDSQAARIVIERIDGKFAADTNPQTSASARPLTLKYGSASFPYDAESAAALFDAAVPSHVPGK